jgi:nucleotide-binding universal stress UspA family protein
MTADSQTRRIVVGYDGSPAARAALALAADRAGDDGHIYVVHAYSLPADWLGTPGYRSLLDNELERAKSQLERLEEESGVDLHGVDWETELISDRPARAIAGVAAAREADEIIVGTRGSGRARALLGSVSHELIHLAERPVTVIPERAVERMAEHTKALATP